jgi:hypothetical protein
LCLAERSRVFVPVGAKVPKALDADVEPPDLGIEPMSGFDHVRLCHKVK